MARPRRTPKAPPSRAGGKRDYQAEYLWRVRGVPKGQRAAARGHRGVRDLERSIGEGDLVMLQTQLGSVETYTNSQGVDRYRRIEVLLIDDEGGPDREYVLRGLSRDQVEALVTEIEDAGGVFSPSPSLDLRRL